MQKIKITIGTLVFVGMGILITSPAKAAVLAIQQLPSYINNNNFKLSCTSDGGSVQFQYSKNGGAFTNFGSAINTDSDACIVQVDSSVVNDQTSYVFRAGGQSTSTTYDSSGPSPVSGYYKERINDGLYKLHFHTPSDSDFASVIIYRGDSADFSADSGHKIATVNGGANSDMTYDDNFTPDSGKSYFYDIRAIDKAGNSSSLTGDGSTTTTTTSVQGTSNPSGKVTILPQEQGSVLGAQTKASPSASPAATSVSTPSASNSASAFNLISWIFGHKKISLLVLVVIAIIGYFIYRKK